MIELRDLAQAGLELAFTGKGQLNETTGWEAGIETLTPFITNIKDDKGRDATELTNIESTVKLTSNITSWAALSYSYKSQIKPQLIDRNQQTHLMVININYNVF